MDWLILAQPFSTLISMVRLGCISDSEKDPEILILRHQLNILERKQKRLVRPNRAEKLILAVLTARLKKATKRPAGKLHAVIRISSRRQSYGGIGNWCAASGHSGAKRKVNGRASVGSSRP